MNPTLDKSGETRIVSESGIELPGDAILDRWSRHCWRDAVSIDELSAFDRVIVTTQNHTYEIVVTSPDERSVLLRGGDAFPDFVAARLVGCSLGGSTIKLRTVAVGFRLEVVVDRRCLITSPVETIAVMPAGTARCTL